MPSYVPLYYTNLDWTAIAQNAPVIAWMESTDAAWDPKQEFHKDMHFRDKKSMREAVKAYSIDKGLYYKVELSNKSIWVANCRKGKEKC